MVIREIVHKTNAKAPPIDSHSFLTDSIGFWGVVKEVDSKSNTVTVISATKFEYKGLPVVSGEWVTVDEKKDYIPSQRNLPPVNSWVFVLTPTRTATGAFVLCSGFTRGDENIRQLWAKDDDELEEKNNCRETKTQGGWDITEEYANGNFKAESNDGNIKIVANTTQDDDKDQNKEVSVKAWNNTIIIDDNGLSVIDRNGNKVEVTEDGIKLLDKHGNYYESKSITEDETDKNVITINNTVSSIVMKDNKVTINNHLEVTK